MTPIVIGTREDVVGFALAGVGGIVCSTADEVEHALDSIATDQIVILSAPTALLVQDTIGEWEKTGRGPMFVVLGPS